jgi:hypothetical protein
MKTNTANSAAKAGRSLKLTIGGEIAEEIREVSRVTHLRPMSIATSALRSGLLMTGESPDAREHQIEMAADCLGISVGTARALRAEAERRKAFAVPC